MSFIRRFGINLSRGRNDRDMSVRECRYFQGNGSTACPEPWSPLDGKVKVPYMIVEEVSYGHT